MNNENDREINIEVLAKRSSHNNVRIAYRKVQNNFYYLILNYFLSEGEIKSKIKEGLNRELVKKLFENKNEVLFLEEEKIDDELILEPH